MVQGGSSEKFAFYRSSNEINHPRNPGTLLEQKGLHRILVEAQEKSILAEAPEKSLKPLIEIRNELVASWKKISHHCEKKDQIFYKLIIKGYNKVFCNKIKEIDDDIAKLKKASLFQKTLGYGHDDRQIIKKKICNELSNLLSMHELVYKQYRNKKLGVLVELEKKGLDGILKKDQKFLKDLIEIRNQLVLSYNTTSFAYKEMNLNYEVFDIEALDKFFSNKINEIDAMIPIVGKASLVNKKLGLGHDKRQSTKDEICGKLKFLIQLQEDMCAKYNKLLEDKKEAERYIVKIYESQAKKNMDKEDAYQDIVDIHGIDAIKNNLDGKDAIQDAVEIDESEATEKKLNIAVLEFGGTILSVPIIDEHGRTITVQPSEAKKRGFDKEPPLKEWCKEKYGDNVNFAFIPIKEILSENIGMKERIELIRDLKNKINFGLYDGIILTHGSDSVGDTAPLLSLAMHDIPVPMMLITSHDTLDNLEANGYENFMGAVNFIKHVKIPGVFVPYHSKGTTEINHASRILNCETITDHYNSISTDEKGNKAYRPLGIMFNNGNFGVIDEKLFDGLISEQGIPVENDDLNIVFSENQEDRLFNKIASLGYQDLEDKIPVIPPNHGSYDNFDIDGIKSALQTGYHSGAADDKKLLKFMKECKSRGKEVYLLLYGPGDMKVYDSIDILRKAGIKTIMNMSAEMAHKKLYLAHLLCKNEKDIEDFLYTPINHEFTSESTRLQGTYEPTEISE